MSDNYFNTTACTSATLAGLIFVSLSINIKRILDFKHLPSRGLVALMMIVNVTLVSTFCLLHDRVSGCLDQKLWFAGEASDLFC